MQFAKNTNCRRCSAPREEAEPQPQPQQEVGQGARGLAPVGPSRARGRCFESAEGRARQGPLGHDCSTGFVGHARAFGDAASVATSAQDGAPVKAGAQDSDCGGHEVRLAIAPCCVVPSSAVPSPPRMHCLDSPLGSPRCFGGGGRGSPRAEVARTPSPYGDWPALGWEAGSEHKGKVMSMLGATMHGIAGAFGGGIEASCSEGLAGHVAWQLPGVAEGALSGDLPRPPEDVTSASMPESEASVGAVESSAVESSGIDSEKEGNAIAQPAAYQASSANGAQGARSGPPCRLHAEAGPGGASGKAMTIAPGALATSKVLGRLRRLRASYPGRLRRVGTTRLRSRLT